MTKNNEMTSQFSIYDESISMMLGSLIIYIFAELRDMIREAEDLNKEKPQPHPETGSKNCSSLSLADLEPPMTTAKVLELIKAYKDALVERSISHEELESRLQALHQFHQTTNQDLSATPASNPPTMTMIQNILSIFCGSTIDSTSPSDKNLIMSQGPVLRQFVDNNATEELVHALVVNPMKKRITVVFRGSVTPKDFLQDAKCAQVKVPNPVFNQLAEENKDRFQSLTSSEIEKELQMPARIGLHTGFYQYLHHKRRNKTGGESSLTRIEEILRDTVALLKEYPGFSLYATGHSLGGALSTLFGFYAATDPKIQSMLPLSQPIVVYSIASPFCGNWKFRHAFQYLERRGLIHHLRISNHEDMVTLLPFAVPKASFLSPAISMVRGGGNLYKHVGVHLQMKSLGDKIHHDIRYPKDGNCEDEDDYAKEIKAAVDAGKSLARSLYHLCTSDFKTVEKHHSCDEYEARLKDCKESLSSLTLSGLYEDKEVVGEQFLDSFSPTLMQRSGFQRTLRAFKALTTSRPPINAITGDDDVEELTLSEAVLGLEDI